MTATLDMKSKKERKKKKDIEIENTNTFIRFHKSHSHWLRRDNNVEEASNSNPEQDAENASKCLEIIKNYQNHNISSVAYFFRYKKEFFPSKQTPQKIDPSCKMDLDLWDCLGRVKLVL